MKKRNYLRYYLLCRSVDLQTQMSHKFDFLIFLVSDLLTQIATLVFIEVIFYSVPEINGYSYIEVLFIYGFFSLSYGIFALLFWPLYDFNHIVISGNLDNLLLKPVSPLLQSLSRGIGDIGGIVIGVFVVTRAILLSGIEFSLISVILFLFFVILGAFILLLTYVLVASLALYFPNISGNFVELINNGLNFAKYPVSIFPKLIRVILMYAIPIGLITFVPYLFFFNCIISIDIIYLFCAIILYTIIVTLFWKHGIKRYRGIGNHD